MKRPGKLLFGLLPGVFACASLPLSAQVVDVGACRAIQDSLERFACYEALGSESDPAPAAPAAITPQAAPTPAPAPSASRTPPPAPRNPVAEAPAPAPAAADTAVAEFGLEPSRGRVVENEHGEQELHATVAQIKRLLPTLLEITLEDGQVWRQTQSKPYNLRIGDEVRIYPTRWGDAFRLTAPRTAGYIQVSRIR